jgi:hypothetical protein
MGGGAGGGGGGTGRGDTGGGGGGETEGQCDGDGGAAGGVGGGGEDTGGSGNGGAAGEGGNGTGGGDSGALVDVFRQRYPKLRGAYTCWHVASGAQLTNYGSRIDYFLLERSMVPAVDRVGVAPGHQARRCKLNR